MSIRIGPERMAAEVDGVVVAAARWNWHAAADGSGAWIASTHASRLFTRDQAISAMAADPELGRPENSINVLNARFSTRYAQEPRRGGIAAGEAGPQAGYHDDVK